MGEIGPQVQERFAHQMPVREPFLPVGDADARGRGVLAAAREVAQHLGHLFVDRVPRIAGSAAGPVRVRGGDQHNGQT